MTFQNILTLENESIRAEFTPHGAELCALIDKKHDCNVLKRRDDTACWDRTAPVLFPICGRLWEQTCYVDGKAYRMGTHGFAKETIFTVSEQDQTHVVFTTSDSDSIREGSYPFGFLLTVEYTLDGASLTTRVRVKNRDDRPLPFAVGFHPGFTVPLDKDGELAEVCLDFCGANDPAVWKLTPNGFRLGEYEPYPLEGGHILRLSGERLANINSLFFKGAGNAVTFASSASDRRIRLDYEGFPYLGLWRPSNPNAHYLCIEPWIGSPDLNETSTELSDKEDMILLPPGEEHSVAYRITVA